MEFDAKKMRQQLATHVAEIKQILTTDLDASSRHSKISAPLLEMIDKLAEPINYIMLKIDETHLLINSLANSHTTLISQEDAKQMDDLVEAYDFIKTEILAILEEKTKGKISLSLNQVRNILLASIKEEYRLVTELNKQIAGLTKHKLYRSYSF